MKKKCCNCDHCSVNGKFCYLWMISVHDQMECDEWTKAKPKRDSC